MEIYGVILFSSDRSMVAASIVFNLVNFFCHRISRHFNNAYSDNAKGLTPEQISSVYEQIARETGLRLNIPKEKEIIRHMWNHRHHLHVSEVGSPDVH